MSSRHLWRASDEFAARGRRPIGEMSGGGAAREIEAPVRKRNSTWRRREAMWKI